MKKTKLMGILSVVIALVLLAAGIFVGFDRGADVGGAYVLTVSINEDFKHGDIEAIMKEAGATSSYVQSQQGIYNTGYKSNQVAVITFEVERDADITAIHEKAEKLLSEKYFLKFPGELTYVASTYNKDMAISMWPAIFIVVVLLAYVFIRFGIKLGNGAIFSMVTSGAATVGIIGLAGIKVTGYTLPALMLTLSLTYAFVVLFGFINKENIKKHEDKNIAFEITAKQIVRLAVITLAIGAIAAVIMLVSGETMLKNFAVTLLIGTVFSMVSTIFVLPSFIQNNK